MKCIWKKRKVRICIWYAIHIGSACCDLIKYTVFLIAIFSMCELNWDKENTKRKHVREMAVIVKLYNVYVFLYAGLVLRMRCWLFTTIQMKNRREECDFCWSPADYHLMMEPQCWFRQIYSPRQWLGFHLDLRKK